MIATDLQPTLPDCLVPQGEIIYTTLDDPEGLKARGLASALYHQARTECDAVAVLGRTDNYYVMARGEVRSYYRDYFKAAIYYFERELDETIYPDPMVLAFDPAAITDEDFRRIWDDETARILWLGLRYRRIVNQYFKAHVESLAKSCREALEKGQLTRTWLAGIFSYMWDIFGSQEPTSIVAARLWPYLTGAQKFNLKIEVKKR
jgi:hypothetical protein